MRYEIRFKAERCRDRWFGSGVVMAHSYVEHWNSNLHPTKYYMFYNYMSLRIEDVLESYYQT